MQLCSFLADGEAAPGLAGVRAAAVSGPGTLIDLSAAAPPLSADLGALRLGCLRNPVVAGPGPDGRSS